MSNNFILNIFIDYVITVLPIFLLCPHTPSNQLPSSSPSLSSCPWVVHISTLASPFPILFLTSPVYFVPTKYASFLKKIYCYSITVVWTIYNSQVLEATWEPISKWVNPKTMVHLHTGILRSRKKELIPFATAWMELESIMLSEVSQTVRDKYHMISPLTGT